MKTVYLLTRYSIKEKKFVHCGFSSLPPTKCEGGLWSTLYEMSYNTIREAACSIVFLIVSGRYPQEWNEVLHLMIDSDKEYIEQFAKEMVCDKDNLWPEDLREK